MISPDTSSFSYTTYSAFCARVRRIAFPDGVGESQKAAFDVFLANALIKAQRYVDCLRTIQVSFFDKASMFEHCGVSQITGPRGRINVVYAFKPGETCIKHFYRPATPAHITCWSRENSCKWLKPPGVGTETFGSGSEACYAYEELYGTSDENDQCWRCEPKFVARGQNGEIWLAPRPPCGYIVAVHWEGIRRRWSSTDAIPDDEDLIDWVAEQVQGEMSMRVDRDLQFGAALKQEASTKFGDLMYWCNEERLLQMRVDCANGIDTGNLNQMFQPIYPYEGVTETGGGGDGGDGGDGGPEPPEPTIDALNGGLYVLDDTLAANVAWREVTVYDGTLEVAATGGPEAYPEQPAMNAVQHDCMIYMKDTSNPPSTPYRILYVDDGVLTLSGPVALGTCINSRAFQTIGGFSYFYDATAAITDPTLPWRMLTCSDGALVLSEPMALPTT